MKLKNIPPTLYIRLNLTIITILICFMPLARGGVHDWMKAVLVIGVLSGILVLLVEKLQTGKPDFQVTPLFLPICGLLFWLFFSATMSQVKPVAFESIFLALIYIGFYFLLIHCIRTRKQQRYIVYVILTVATLLSIIGYLKLAGITLPWWQYPEIRENEFMTSTYGNHNHLAGYLEMSLPFLFSLLLIRKREVSTVLLLTSLLLFIASAHILALSRGGWAAFFISLLFMTTVLIFMKRFKAKKTLSLILVSFLLVCAFTIAGTNILERALTLTENETVVELNGRSLVWQGTREIINENLLKGTGPGTFRVVNTRYQPVGMTARFYHAHNDYLQYIAELGVPVVFFMIWSLSIIFYKGFKKLKSKSRQTWGFTLGALTGIVALLVHSFVDFNLRIPANTILFIALIALVMSSFRSSSSRVNGSNDYL